MKIWLAISIVIITGCGTGSDGTDNNNHGYGFQYDAQGVTGLKLRYSAAPPSDPLLMEPAHYETVFEQVKTCTGLKGPIPPFIILTNLGELGPQILGLYRDDPSLILIQQNAPPSILAHEMIHYLLDVNTGDPDVNHKSHFFVDCV